MVVDRKMPTENPKLIQTQGQMFETYDAHIQQVYAMDKHFTQKMQYRIGHDMKRYVAPF